MILGVSQFNQHLEGTPNASALEREDKKQTMLMKLAFWSGTQSLNFCETMSVPYKQEPNHLLKRLCRVD